LTHASTISPPVGMRQSALPGISRPFQAPVGHRGSEDGSRIGLLCLCCPVLLGSEEAQALPFAIEQSMLRG